MKIATLTYQRHDNYGAMLQCFALHHELKELGVESEIIDYICDVADKPFSVSALKSKGCFRYLLGVAGEITRIPRAKKFNDFRKKLKMTKPYTKETIDQLDDKYDGYIVGSDVVWNAPITGMDENYFLPFVSDKRKRVSYAASFGSTQIDNRFEDIYRNNLKEFAILTSREKSGRDLIERLTGRKAMAVCDPTLLLTAEKWREEAIAPIKKEKYLLAYQLVPSIGFLKLVKNLAKEKNLKIIYIPFPYGYVKSRIQLTIGPLEWLGLFDNAECIVTDSFHGCVFSTLFHKQFFVRISQLGERITNHLGSLNLMDRIVNDAHEACSLEDIDYEKVQPLLDLIREDGVQKLQGILDYFSSLSDNAIENPIKCTGCGLCAISCPVKAIVMKKDPLGFSYPYIDQNKCVECNTCKVVCEQMKKRCYGRGDRQEYYGAVHNEKKVLCSSSSGGAFYAAAKSVLNNGGIVIGAAYQKGFVIGHEAIQNIEMLSRLMGTKYAQSSIEAIYPILKSKIEQGTSILFAGTPCQCAAVEAYCSNNRLCREKLVLMDIFCHGVLSPGIWEDYIIWLQKEFDDQIVEVSFRDKEKGWQNRYLKICGHKSNISGFCNTKASILQVYDKSIALRKSCYHCTYMSLDRVGDISVGDFWGIERTFPRKDKNCGASVIIVNTQVGEELLQQMKKEMDIFACKKEDIIQPVLYKRLGRNIQRTVLKEEYVLNGIEGVMHQFGKVRIISRIKRDLLIPVMYRLRIFGWVSRAVIYLRRAKDSK